LDKLCQDFKNLTPKSITSIYFFGKYSSEEEKFKLLVKILQKCIFVLVVVEKGHDGRPRGGFFGQECHFLAAVEALLGALSGLRGAAAGTVVGRRQRRRNYRRQLRQQGVALRVRFSVA